TIRLRRLYLRGIAIMPRFRVQSSEFRVQSSEFQLSRLGMLVVRKGGLPPLPGLGPETAGVNLPSRPLACGGSGFPVVPQMHNAWFSREPATTNREP